MQHIYSIQLAYACPTMHCIRLVVAVLTHSVPQLGRTALIWPVACSGHTDVVQLLLSSGAQVDMQDCLVRHNINCSRTLVKGQS